MITLDNVSKRYGSATALAQTTLDIAEGKSTVLIGPSGCGKSTLLRIIVGLITTDTGQVLVDGVPLTVTNIQDQRHKMGYVIQDGGLFPHLTAEHNVTLLAKYLKRPDDEIAARVKELAAMVQIPTDLLGRFPNDLSGGQRQRISLMRALILDPEILLLDEPLGALDPITRSELQQELKAIFQRLTKTVVLVTHDMGEAAYFGDEIILMRSGSIVQKGTLDQMLNQPAHEYVTAFIRAQRSPLPALPEAL